jgi:3-oxoadipate enol-lactonase
MPLQRVGDVELYYELIDWTEPWKSGRLPVLLIHGLGGDHRFWLYQVPALCGRFPVLLVDLRGHGASTKPAGDFTIADMAQDLVRLLRALGVERVHAVGSSLGGLVAQQLALDHPFATASLVLAGTFCVIPDDLAGAARAALQLIEENDMAAIASARITNAFSDAVDPVVRGYFIDRVAGNDPPTYRRAARAAFAFSACDRLAELELPALVVVGEEDRVTPPALAETLAARIRGARLAPIAGAGHICNVDQPEAFNRILLDFLEKG